MDHAARRSLLAAAALTTAGALTLAPITIAPNDIHAPSVSAVRISTQVVQLTDAWSELLTNTVGSTIQLAGMVLGLDSGAPLPNPTIPLAPIATQLVLNQLVYVGQLLTGQGGQIPNEILTHLGKIQNIGVGLSNDLPGIIVAQLQTPFAAVQAAITYYANTTNKLIALLEAPAVFLDFALNSQYGLLGFNGPIAVPIYIRNALAKAIETPIPPIVLPFKKAAAATSKPPSAAATTATPSGTASSARSKPAAPASGSREASAKSNKAPAAKSSTKNGTGKGHSNRG